MRSRLKFSSGSGNTSDDLSEPCDASRRATSEVSMTSRATKNRRPANRGRQTQLRYQSLEPRQLLVANFLITEFQASNDSTLVDDSGRNSDWIEIYNAGDTAGNLSGYSLTDDASDPTKWTFPSAVLQPNDFLIVFAEDDVNLGSGSDFYTGFKLSASGEYLGLFDPSGNVVSQYDSNAGEYPAQQSDGSYGLGFMSGGSRSLVQPIVEGYFVDPTPGEANSLQFQGVVAPVNVSVDAGFYETQFPLTLTTATPGANIRFTIDGSTPTQTNGFNYNSAVAIPSSVNLRAIAFKDGFIPSPIATRTYLFLDDVLNQSNNESAPPGWPSFWGGNDVDYGMDPQVIAIEGEQAVKDALLSIPTWSITTDLDNLFDPSTGIYSNATEDGREWERPASVELINPDGEEGFQIDAGIRIRGGYSRNDFNPKHSFRLFFRSEYGQSTLNYPIHGDEGVDEFRKIDLRTAQNYSWSSEGDSRNNFVQDVLARYAQRELGQPYTRSSWLHLYLNGQYWGLFQTQERAEANYAASYFGGDPDDYDVIKAEWFAANPTDGNLAAYHRLSDQAHARASDGVTPAFVDNAAYYRAQGLNTDETVNPDFEPLLDVDNLITYMMIVLAGGNLDAPISNFGNNEHINNFYTIRNRNGNEGFKFLVHDSEHTLLNVNENRNGPFNSPNFDNGNAFFNPQWLHQQLMANDEYRIQFADRVQAAFFNDGPLSAEAQIARLDEEAAKIDQAIIAESVRWGDSKRSNPYLRSDWVNAINNIRNNFLPNRNAVLLEQFRNTELRLRTSSNSYNNVVDAPLFPDVDAPDFLVNGTPTVGGNVATGTNVVPSANEGTIWYTTDGSDPRLVGGAVNADAASFDGSTNDVSVVSAGSIWRYHDSGIDLGTAWRSPNYNDSSWSQGDAQLGYGDGDEATVVSFGGNDSDKHPTTYFRRQFTAPAGDIVSVKLRVVRDDGIVVYLNGSEIARDNLPGGTISYGTTASTFVADENESAFFEFDVPLTALLPGATNTLAVEVHQYAGTQGGSVSSSDLSFDAELVVSLASTGSAPIVINESTTLKARTRGNDGTWSALQVASLVVPSEAASSDNLRVTELQYHSRDSGVEYIEIQNITSGTSATSIDLGGVTITDGPSSPFQFDALATLAPQQYGLIVNDVAAFQAAYPDVDSNLIMGEFAGSLSNGGEQIRFEAADGQKILDFTYNDSDPWPIAADGAGPSLQLVDPSGTPADQLNKPYRWQTSWEFAGTPGTAGVSPSGIVINEVLANSDASQVDSIELYNPTGQPIDIGGWYLSDSKNALTDFQIATGTVLAAGGYIVFDESDFNPTPSVPGPHDFALSGSSGDQVYLTRIVITSDGLSLNFEDAVEFGATFSGESIGRLNDGVGRLVRLQQPTLGSTNSQGRAGPLVISEANYHPPDPTAAALAIDPTFQDNDLEFIEIHNPTGTAIDLTDWRLRGDVDFDFAPSSLSGGQSLIAVSFDPSDTNAVAAFREHYGITGGSFIGPWSGSLSNGYGRVALQSPDTPSPDAPSVIPHVVVDELLYDDVTAALGTDGGGASLARIANARNGNDPDEWFADNPTPGSVDVQADAPTIVSFVRDGSSEVRPDRLTTVEVAFSEDVSVSASSLSLLNESAGGSSVDLSGIGFAYDVANHTATWDFSTLPNLDAAFYSAVLDAGQVQSSASGLLLDGNNNGSSGGVYESEIYVAIPGDTNLDGRVNVLVDGFQLVQNLGSTTGMTWADGDFDGDGDVDILDSNPSIGDGFLFVANIGEDVRPEAATIFRSTEDISSPIAQARQQTSEADAAALDFVTQANSDFASVNDETRRQSQSKTAVDTPILTLSGMADTASPDKESTNFSGFNLRTYDAARPEATESLDQVFADPFDPFA